MNDVLFVCRKLEELAMEAVAAHKVQDRASIYGAAYALLHELEPIVSDLTPDLIEHLRQVRWNIASILGYDHAHGHDHAQHFAWALEHLLQLHLGLSAVAPYAQQRTSSTLKLPPLSGTWE